VALSGEFLVREKLRALRSGNADGSSANDVQRTETEVSKWRALRDFSNNESDHAVLVEFLSEESQDLHSKLLTEYQGDFAKAFMKYMTMVCETISPGCTTEAHAGALSRIPRQTPRRRVRSLRPSQPDGVC
jgi:hypothetical protein